MDGSVLYDSCKSWHYHNKYDSANLKLTSHSHMIVHSVEKNHFWWTQSIERAFSGIILGHRHDGLF